MKGLRHFFSRLCKEEGVKVVVGNRWHCNFQHRKPVITVPEQYTEIDIFYGLHELAHAILHKDDSRSYDDLAERIEIEMEADGQANAWMLANGLSHQANNYTLGLIARLLLEGGEVDTYSIESQGSFVILNRFGIEIFSQFESNLPIHPAI